MLYSGWPLAIELGGLRRLSACPSHDAMLICLYPIFSSALTIDGILGIPIPLIGLKQTSVPTKCVSTSLFHDLRFCSHTDFSASYTLELD